ncbi:hypothetical protein HYV80_05810 [Candidatus Woesearchaeota archaeon]|nr:hypothetical protein [Candidatus Woesearchaeota archaeon]
MKPQKEKKKVGLMIFLVIIMIGTSFSFIFYGFSPSSEKSRYGEFSFTFMPAQGIWAAKINEKQAAFSFLPDEVKDIPSGNSAKALQNKFEIDSTYDLNSTYREAIALAQHQMGLTLANFNVYVRKGFTSNSTFSLPIITCGDSTSNVPVIYFRQGNSTKIHLEGDCIIAEADANAEFIRVKDRLLYGMLGVIND